MTSPPRCTPLSTRQRYEYGLYGVSLHSEWRLPWREGVDVRLPRVELVERSARFFAAASREADARAAGPRWSHYLPLADGTEYLRWTDLFEFLVSAEHKHDFVATDRSSSLMGSVDGATHKLEQQLRKYKQKVQERHRQSTARRQEAPGEPEAEAEST